MGGVAGHAGVFSTAGDLAVFAHAMLSGGAPIIRPETLALFTRRETSYPGPSRILGWAKPTSPSQTGNYFSPSFIAHLGYTGTSLWIVSDRLTSATLHTQ